MFFIPGFLISFVTFPGVIVHEIAHRFFCDLAGVPVYKTCYFQFRNPAGYVVHGRTENLGAAFLVTIGPLLVNTVLCALITFSAVIPVFILNVEPMPVASFLLLWIGLSIGMHAIPSTQDGQSFKEQVEDAEGNVVLRGFASLLVAFLWLANLLRVVWFDAIYAVGVAFILPLATGLV